MTPSDVGISGANLYPMLSCSSGTVIPLGHSLKLEHKNGADLSKFDDLLGMTFSQYEVALRGLSALLDVEVRYPITTLLGVMKKIGIPKRLAYETTDLYKSRYGEDYGYRLFLLTTTSSCDCWYSFKTMLEPLFPRSWEQKQIAVFCFIQISRAGPLWKHNGSI